jgi:hypothetical protein
MAVNLYKVKKWGAGFMMAFFPTITFLVMILTADFLMAVIGFLMVVPFSMFLGFRLTSHPLHEFLEGKGLMVWTVDSTGTIEPFIVQVDNPFLRGMHRGKKVETIFSRESIAYMKEPQNVGGTMEQDPEDPNIEKLTIRIPKDKKTSITYGLQQFPVLIYNKNLGEFISKDAFSKFEKDTFVTHMVLYLNRKVEDLTSSLRDFARYIVEQTRPRASIWGAPWVKWVLVGGAILFLMIILAPYVLQAFVNVGGEALEGSKDILTPR